VKMNNTNTISDSLTGRSLWFSENPEKARTEKLFILLVPVWVLIMAGPIAVNREFLFNSDIILIPFSLVVALTYVFVPLFVEKKKASPIRWYESYWFKAYLYILVFQLLCNYFISEYFFDVLGMVYNFPNLKVIFDSALIGSGTQSVPFIMYPLTMATYMTYHTTAVVFMRRVVNSRLGNNKWTKWVSFIVVIMIMSYFWAWTETQSFANSAIEKNFRYVNRETMLAFGSIVFGLSLLPSFPVFYHIDEKDSSWSLIKVAGAALAAAMMALFLTDLCTGFIGTIPM
jgi:cycloeucalenol cycloisomerase